MEETADQIRYRGTAHFIKGEFDDAVEAYSAALEKCPNDAVLYSNRAAAYLATTSPYYAYIDCKKGLEIDPNNLKLIYRMAKALYNMQRLGECLELLEKQTEHQNVPEISQLTAKVGRLLQESEECSYNFVQLYAEADVCPHLDHAEHFRSDLIELSVNSDGIRGMYAKVDIEPATLLVASKAYTYKIVTHNPPVTEAEKRPFCEYVMDTLFGDPPSGREYFKLNAGKELLWLDNWGENREDTINPVRLVEIINRNMTYVKSAKDVLSEAIWLVPQLFNHSCVDCNCYSQIIGDFLFIRTIKKVRQGEELTRAYFLAYDPYEKRQYNILVGKNYECKCRLCVMEGQRSDSDKLKVKKIQEQLEQIDNAGNEMNASQKIHRLKKLEKMAREVDADHPELQILAWEALKRIASIYLKQNRYMQCLAIQEELEVLNENLGLLEDAMDYTFTLTVYFKKLEETEKYEKWKAKSDELTKLMLGPKAALKIYMKKRAEICS